MPASRSGREFMRRNGLTEESPAHGSRLAMGDLLVHFLPVPTPPGLSPGLLRRFEDPHPKEPDAAT